MSCLRCCWRPSRQMGRLWECLHIERQRIIYYIVRLQFSDTVINHGRHHWEKWIANEGVILKNACVMRSSAFVVCLYLMWLSRALPLSWCSQRCHKSDVHKNASASWEAGSQVVSLQFGSKQGCMRTDAQVCIVNLFIFTDLHQCMVPWTYLS